MNMNEEYDIEPVFHYVDEDVPSIHDDDYDEDDNYPKADGGEDDEDETDIHDDYSDDDMDGDAGSAFASIGWGTDEDYGYYGGGDE